MWTTDFSDQEASASLEGEMAKEELLQNKADLENISAETVRGCWELENNQPLQFHKPTAKGFIFEKIISQNFSYNLRISFIVILRFIVLGRFCDKNIR